MEQKERQDKRNVAITGLTAAGKTTHARIIQAEFDLGYVSASTILREKAGFKNEPPGDFWISADGKALSSRIVEFGIDEALRDTENLQENIVFDCRSLPWLTRNPILSIWLESSLDSRVWKSMISHQKGAQRTVDDVRREIMLKDESDRKKLMQTFGFDLFKDYEPMDVIIDLSSLIAAPTVQASWRSIQVAQDILSAVVGLYFTAEDFYRLRLRGLQESLGASVFRRFSARFMELLGG